ncbi:MAG: hypothetical protein BGO96_09215 [Micrococcales bacterium 73-15]|uniref:hypothetical protein n=1 Tax=Salana multivorans TaxID=120377 RepID=UPI000969488F|nr:hypothetical protein [Salana multivorans]OJX93993.1 MAG: hypothetical protein BGO96_09215 [Micrococcales bacterium 73-15]
MSTLTRSEAVTFYAARVRAALHPLTPDVVDDLTDGLEADLTEAVLDELELTEGDDGERPGAALASLDPDALEARFGAPDAYAAELASAAGVEIGDGDADGAAVPRPTMRERLAARRQRVRARVEAFAEANPLARTGLEILAVLRPVWWVARGWGWYVVGFALLGRQVASYRHLYLPGHLLGWLVLLTFVVLSVQLGRGRYWQGRWTRRLGLVASWVGGIAAFVALVNVTSITTTDYSGREHAAYVMGLDERSNGVYIDGAAATNLFVYGPDGQPLPDVRIVDQAGRWVVLSSPWDGRRTWNDVDPEEAAWWSEDVPLALFDEDTAVNQYPLVFINRDEGGYPAVERDEEGNLRLPTGADLAQPVWPQPSLLPLPGFEQPAAVTPSPEPTAGAAEPSAAPTGETEPGAETEPDAETVTSPEPEASTGAGAAPEATAGP